MITGIPGGGAPRGRGAAAATAQGLVVLVVAALVVGVGFGPFMDPGSGDRPAGSPVEAGEPPALSLGSAPGQGAPRTVVDLDPRGGAAGTDVAPPLTAAEASGHARTSRSDEVQRFLERLDALPHGARLSREVFGRTGLGRPMVAVTARMGEGGDIAKPAVLVNANIHGGEVEGKEAVQEILREIALGEHTDILRAFDVVFVPIYNVDGNDAIARRNRVTQNGPDGGVGRRENAAGLDLNRDFVKLETPEGRALMALVNRVDPVAFFDLHTTNGSRHGHDLTYASSLSPNAGPALDALAREGLFPDVRAALAERGIHVFDYGNFEYAPRERGSRGERGDPIAWSTYDGRPRFGTNLMGLRGTLAVLSEAFSYLPYERRIEATRAFTLECLRWLARERDAVLAAVDADRRRPAGRVTLAVDQELIEGELAPVRTGSWETVEVDIDAFEPGVQPGTRRVAAPSSEARLVEMRVRDRFVGRREVDAGVALAVVDPSVETIALLTRHLGRAPRALESDWSGEASVFVALEANLAGRPFQGHRVARVRGAWDRRVVTLPAGTLVVRSTRLTAHLLHPESDDSLTTWNHFDGALFGPLDGEDAERLHPVVVLDAWPGD